MKNKMLRKSVLFIALGVGLSMMVPMHSAFAANTDGSLVGQTAGGAEVTVRDPDTGFTRTVTADANGRYRIPFLPVGSYTVQASKDGAPLGEVANVTVSLGNAANVNIGGGPATLGTVQVIGSRVVTAVDVSSTESATNITHAELTRLPVQRDAASVAVLAPGVNRAGFGGLSFGGSSVAENTVYINGLNVTDFYKRIDFSSIPEEFFKEYQIKTGGYSVEFGRTTGGVINAVTQSGTNEFHFGGQVRWEPTFLQTRGEDKDNPTFLLDGVPTATKTSYRYDDFDRRNVTLHASGPIIKDKLFFYALYEFRNLDRTNVSNSESQRFLTNSGDDFWGAKFDWNINDRNSLQLLAFSDKNGDVRNDYCFKDIDPDTGVANCERGAFQNRQFIDSGGTNWALTYTGNLTDAFSVKAMYGGNERTRVQKSLNDIDCSRVRDRRTGDDVGCTTSGNVVEGLDKRKAARLDFEWSLGDHLLRFGLDHELNRSDNTQFYPGPTRLLYEINSADPGDTLANGGVVPNLDSNGNPVTAYVRTRQQEVSGTFDTINSAYYLEDNWQATPNLVLNGGLRFESFNNKNGEGNTYIQITNQIAPRFGLSWDVKGDQRSKLFANVGRYFLPVANIINIKQAGAFLDERTFYVFDGFENFTYNGQTYQRPILGAQIGAVDNSQGDGTVGDLRGEVDAKLEQVYQDELILGYQSLITDKWSWGVRGIYRKLHNAVDDMQITYNGFCEISPFVVANPGRDLTFYTDTDCDGENDAFVTLDTSKEGWALYDDNNNFVGQRGWVKPRRNYKSLEFTIDRAWDEKWALNASYTLAYGRGNAEGPVNTDTGFDDTGRTEHFDDPWVNLNAYGPLPNDRRHQFKLRGSFALNNNWTFGATLNAQSGTPISGFGVGNPFDATNYHSQYICVQNCGNDPLTGDQFLPSQRVYELSRRGAYGTTPWTYNIDASVNYHHAFAAADLRVTFSVFNLLNSTRVTDVDQDRQTTIGNALNPTFGFGTDYQLPRYAQLRVGLEF
ncbi:MAG: carboxypeptidase regulatory-like domain-containing protein [Luteimonas sp.]